MRSGFRALFLSAAAVSVSGCSMLQPKSEWMDASLFEEMQNAEEYADFLTARYADMAGDPAEAATFYRRSFDRSPGDPSALELATLSTLVAAETDVGIDLVTGADPQVAAASPTAQFVLAVEDIANSKAPRALVRLKTADIGNINQDVKGFLIAWLTAASDTNAGVVALDQLYDQQSARRMLAGEQVAMKGLIFLAAGRDVEALHAFDQAARLPLGAPDYLASIRARLMAATGDGAGARKLIETLVEETGATSGTEQVLALIESGKPIPRPQISLRQGAAIAVYLATAGRVARFNSDLAIMRYSLALRLDPGLGPARLAIVDALNERDRPEDALAQLRGISQNSPLSADARLKEAWLLNNLDRPAEALAAADQALAGSRRRDVLVGVGDLYRINGNNLRAEALYSEVIEGDMAANAHDWRVLFTRASVREAAGNWKDAETDLTAALVLEPDRPELQNFLGYAWVNRGIRVQEGMALIRKAVAARPDQGYIVDSLGWAQFSLGEYEEAVETLERAAELSPSDAEIVDHLGDAYWRTGRAIDAAYEWRRALQLDPDPAREAALHTKLDKGLPPLPAASLAAAGHAAPQGAQQASPQ